MKTVLLSDSMVAAVRRALCAEIYRLALEIENYRPTCGYSLGDLRDQLDVANQVLAQVTA